MKSGMGSPNYDPAIADQARRAGMAGLTRSGKRHAWTPAEARRQGQRAVQARQTRRRFFNEVVTRTT